MSIPTRALLLEHQYVELGEPTLFTAFRVIRERWLAGHRNRESALHLAFLAWFMLIEEEGTGYESTAENAEELYCAIDEAYEYLNPARSDDAEVLYVFAVMANIAPWYLGDVSEVVTRAEEFLAKLGRLRPDGLAPEVFSGRGAFGHYFAGHAQNDRFLEAARKAMDAGELLAESRTTLTRGGTATVLAAEPVCVARCRRGASVDWVFNRPVEQRWLSSTLFFGLVEHSTVLAYPHGGAKRLGSIAAGRLAGELEKLARQDASDVSLAARFLLPVVRLADEEKDWEIYIEA